MNTKIDKTILDCVDHVVKNSTLTISQIIKKIIELVLINEIPEEIQKKIISCVLDVSFQIGKIETVIEIFDEIYYCLNRETGSCPDKK